MDTYELTDGQKGARTLLVIEAQMRGIALTNSEMRSVILGLPFAEWPQELKDKTANFSATVQAEDEKARPSK